MRPSARQPNERGFAIVIALVTIVVLAATVLSAVTQFQSHSMQVERRGEDYALESAVETATDFAINSLWNNYRGSLASNPFGNTVDGIRYYLDSIGCTDQSTATPPNRFDLGAHLGLDFDGDGSLELSGIDVEELSAMRIDSPTAVEMQIIARVATRVRNTAKVTGGWVREVETSFVFEPERWGGLDYTLLANNVNCILCHLKVDTTERVYRTHPGPFERAKVGTLEQLLMRSNADSVIVGTLHAAGPITDKYGVPIDWDDATLTAAELTSDGTVVEDDDGDPVQITMTPSNGSIDEYGSVYESYGTTAMADGELPARFPPPFPDDGGKDPGTGMPTTEGAGNRTVDPNEFWAVTRDYRGTISGGQIHVVPPGEKIETEADLTVAMSSDSVASISDTIEGQVFLTGTESNPIVLNGDIAIDGNVVIRGWVKGRGAIWVSENAYAPVDVRYVDGDDGSGNRTFGRSSDGTENLLVLTAGGNVILGDAFQPYRVGSSIEGLKPSFVEMEASIFNRAEWAKTQPTLPGPSGTTITNPTYVPGYVPRYYIFDSSGQVGIFNVDGHFDATGTWQGEEHPDRWNTDYMTFADPSDPNDPLLYDGAGDPIAKLSPLRGGDSWITDELLDRMVDESYDGRPNSKLQYDLFAYTNNAIFGITSSYGTNNTNNELLINGGIVAADVGVLAAGGADLNYDGRVNDALRILGSERVVVQRQQVTVLR